MTLPALDITILGPKILFARPMISKFSLKWGHGLNCKPPIRARSGPQNRRRDQAVTAPGPPGWAGRSTDIRIRCSDDACGPCGLRLYRGREVNGHSHRMVHCTVLRPAGLPRHVRPISDPRLESQAAAAAARAAQRSCLGGAGWASLCRGPGMPN